MKKILLSALMAASLSACAGDVKENLGLRMDGPDEFAVERKPKLEVPPSFKLRPPTPGEDPLNNNSPRDAARDALLGTTEKPKTADASGEALPNTDPLAGLTDDFKLSNPADDAAAKPAEDKIEVPAENPAEVKTESTPEAKAAEPAPVAAAEKSEGENALLKSAGATDGDPAIRAKLKEEYREEQDVGVVGTLEKISNDNFDKTVVDPAAEKERIVTNKKENKPITEGETPAKSINDDKSVLEKIFN